MKKIALFGQRLWYLLLDALLIVSLSNLDAQSIISHQKQTAVGQVVTNSRLLLRFQKDHTDVMFICIYF